MAEAAVSGRSGTILRGLPGRAGGGALLAILLLAAFAVVGPLFSPHAPDALDWEHVAAPPGLSASHWLGTDRLGRDVYVRSLQGLRLSLLIGVMATVVSLCIGIAWGAVAGYVGGRVDEAMMRTVDVLDSLPFVFVVIVLTALFGRGNAVLLFLAIGAVGWLTVARIVRGQTLALRRRPFVEAAVAMGARATWVLRRHVVPNVVGPVIVYAALTVPQLILYESFLSFLGLGVQEPLASLGTLIGAGARDMESAPWLLLVPAGLLALLLVAFDRLGEALRRELDARGPGDASAR